MPRYGDSGYGDGDGSDAAVIDGDHAVAHGERGGTVGDEHDRQRSAEARQSDA